MKNKPECEDPGSIRKRPSEAHSLTYTGCEQGSEGGEG